MDLNVPAVNTTKYGLKSISYSCAKMWNSLNNNISPAVEWVYLKMFVKVFFSFDYSNIGVL